MRVAAAAEITIQFSGFNKKVAGTKRRVTRVVTRMNTKYALNVNQLFTDHCNLPQQLFIPLNLLIFSLC